MPQEKFLSTRPSLTSRLLSAGFKCTAVPNPYDSSLSAWSFDMTMSLAFAVAEYYKDIRKTPPKAIRDFLRKEAPVTAEEYLE